MAKAAPAKTKSTATKKVAKKPTKVTKKVAPKKTAARRSSSAAKSDFFEAKLTDQSLYWLIFGLAAIIFTLWLFSLDAKVRDLYDEVDANSYNMTLMKEHGTAVTKS